MREYTYIRDEIQKLGAFLIEEQLHPKVFGSAYCVFKTNNRNLFRLVWDGKEEYAFLELAKSQENWEVISPNVNAVSNPKNPKLLALLSTAKVLIHGTFTA